MKLRKAFPLVCLFIVCAYITGCSAVMAGKRSTYRGDPKVLAVGQSRMMVESELGAPDMSSPLEGGKKRVIYKMDPDAHTRGSKSAAIAGHVVADILTLGLWEVAGTPAEIAAQDNMKNYIATYSAANIIESVECH
jgi:hypothetical protein